MYFCSKQIAETAGIGSAGFRAYTKKGGKVRKLTVFESNTALSAFKKAGFTEFYKVTASPENAELIKKYKVRQDNTLIFCAPNGESVVGLAGLQCNLTNTLKVLKSWPMIYQAWQQKNRTRKQVALLPPG